MDGTDPEGMSLLAKVIAAGAPVVAAVWGGVKLWDKKADKHAVNNSMQNITGELAVHRQATREDIRKLYENAENDRKLVRDGFDILSKEMHEIHVSLLNRMDGK